ncbi:MAG: hypothetical protein WBG71_08805 [Leeuwenhoekiella sp.]
MKNIPTIIILAWFIPLSSFCQTNFPIKVALSNEATAVPFTRLFSTPIHPTIQLGTEYLYKTEPHFDLYQTGNLGYIYHNYLYQGIYFNTGIGYDYKFDFGLKLKANFELGYLHTFATREENQFENGGYINGTDWGNSRLMPMLSLGFGYVFRTNEIPSSEVFILYKSWIENPYSPGFIPIMTHINFEIGYKIYINWKHEK